MRLFVALDVPPQARNALRRAVAPLQARHTGLRWTDPRNWHVTLAFLGSQPLGGRLAAELALRRAASGATPCVLRIDGALGRFGRRVLWAAVRPDDAALDVLVDRLRRALADHDLPVPADPFRPHVTLARPRRRQRLPKVESVDDPALPWSWSARRVRLVESRTGGGGSRYRTVATWPLSGTPAT